MKDLREFRFHVVEPALELLQRLGGPAAKPKAVRMLLAIARQEGGPELARHQHGGPAHGAWQFEKNGGVRGVLKHPRSAALANALADSFALAHTPAAVYEALPTNDLLAAGFARLLLWTDPSPLPANEHEAWAEYLMLWRPGRPRPAHWPENWKLSGLAMVDPQ